MQVIIQFPLGDGRVLSSDVTGRVSRPDWGNVDTGSSQFVRYFGRVIDRKEIADPAWVDERYLCGARGAIGFPDLAGSRSIEGAFRRLLVDDSKVVARVEVGLNIRRAPADIGEGYVSLASSIGQMKTTVPESGGPGSAKPLLSQKARIAKLYSFATTRKGIEPEASGLVGAGSPTMVLEVDRGSPFSPPPKAEVLDPAKVGGADLAFTWFGPPESPMPLWIVRPGKDRERTRSLRTCLLRLHAEKQALLVIARLVARGWLHYEPRTDAGKSLTQYLTDAEKRLRKSTWSGISQSAIIEAIDAAESVTYSDDAQGLTKSLEGAQRQIKEKLDEYWKEQEAKRTIDNYYKVEEGGQVVNEKVEITNSHIEGSVIGNRMHDALVNFQKAPVPDDRKQAMEELVKVATDLVEKLDDEKAKETVERRVKNITEEASASEPGEDLIRAAGETIVKIGNGVQELAGPIASAVNKLLSVLKFAPIIL